MTFRYRIFNILAVLLLISSVLVSCKKNWLDAKPEKALVIPSTLRDYQALLDNNVGGFAPFNDKQSTLEEIGAGDFYVVGDTWNNANTIEQNSYTWSTDLYGNDKSYGEWELQYSCIFYTNIILEGIQKIEPITNADQLQWNQVKGSALFFRAYRHFVVAQGYCKAYDKNTAKTDLGIPLRLQSDFNIPSKRSSVEETYNQIINDLIQAADLLPIDKPKGDETLYKLRPTKAAVYAMLARVYLSMSIYDNALTYSSKTLDLYNNLMNYNDIIGGIFKFQRFNPEVILNVTGSAYSLLAVSQLIVDSTLVNSYDDKDRRKDLFFFNYLGEIRFVGNYTRSGTFFTGLATDEMYLIKAECNARAGNKDASLDALNKLIENRWSNTVPYPTITANDAVDALKKILDERRKELCFRNIRWSDLRRLNREPQFAKTLNRVINNGQAYTLTPNSPKYVLPIPPDVIQLTGMEQNLR